LTDSGEAVVLRAEPLGRHMEQMLLGQITQQELVVLKRCLDKLVVTGTEMNASIELLVQQLAAKAPA
jgi:hypothetical protein